MKETWDQNESNSENTDSASAGSTANKTTVKNHLDKMVEQEASDHDDTIKEDRLIDGERATVNDQHPL